MSNGSRRPLLCLSVALAALTACAPASPAETTATSAGNPNAPYNTDIDTLELMVHVIDPGARAFWRGWGSVLTEKGWADTSPKNDDEWKKVEDGAATVVTATNVLLLPAYAQAPLDDWNTLAAAVAKLAMDGKIAAEHQDSEAILVIGEKLDEACDACHAVFGPAQ